MNNENNELQVTQYSSQEIEKKKKSILIKTGTGLSVGLAVGGAALLAILLYFGLNNNNGNDMVSPETRPSESFVVGGSSAWFNSVVEFI